MLITLTSDIVAAYVGNNSVGVDDLPSLIKKVHEALAGLSDPTTDDLRPEPAVSVRSSVKKDHIICLEDGKKMTMLKRHLMTDHGLTPEEYRQRWDLPSDYPMVAPDYAETRRELAIRIGLGRKSSEKATSKRPRPGKGIAADGSSAGKPASRKAGTKKPVAKKAVPQSST